jgi:hypothetical protein
MNSVTLDLRHRPRLVNNLVHAEALGPSDDTADRSGAAQVAGLKVVPAIVRTLDDPAALGVTITENVQRQDLHPLEEAATIQQAFDRSFPVTSP